MIILSKGDMAEIEEPRAAQRVGEIPGAIDHTRGTHLRLRLLQRQTPPFGYSRHQASSDSKTVKRVSGKGTETTNSSINDDYVAHVAVRPAPDGEYSLGTANINLSATATETINSNDQMICPHERTMRQMSGQFVSKNERRGNASGLEAGVDITTDNDGTYSVSVRLPEFQGTASGSNSASFSGQCKSKEATNQKIADVPTTIDAMRFSSSGEDRMQPSDPNRLTGAHSVTSYGVTESLRWNLRRCGGDLRLVDVKFGPPTGWRGRWDGGRPMRIAATGLRTGGDIRAGSPSMMH